MTHSDEITPVDIVTLRASFVQAQAQIMNNGEYTPVVVIDKRLALGLLDEVERLRGQCEAWELTAKRVAVLHAPDAKAAVAEAMSIYENWGKS